jgi:hypothetical protein
MYQLEDLDKKVIDFINIKKKRRLKSSRIKWWLLLIFLIKSKQSQCNLNVNLKKRWNTWTKHVAKTKKTTKRKS